MSRIIELEEGQLEIIFQHTDPCFLLEFVTKYPELEILINSKELRTQLANNLGLPYSTTLKELCTFSQMSVDALFIHACNHGDIRVAKFTYREGVGKSAMLRGSYLAATNGYLDIVKFLANEDNLDILLENAIKGGHLDVIDFLIRKGAVIPDVLSNAIKSGYIDIVQYFLDKGEKLTYQYLLQATSNLEILEYLLEIFDDDVNFDELLHDSRKYLDIDVAVFLVDKGAQVTEEILENIIRDEIYPGSLRSIKLFEFLFENTDVDANNLLVTAVDYEQHGIVRYLIDKVNDLNAALETAVDNRDLEITEILLNEGAMVTEDLIDGAEGRILTLLKKSLLSQLSE